MEQKRFLNIDEAAELLGFKKSYVYKLTSGGVIPHSKPNGKRIYFDRLVLEQWMMRNQTSTDINSLADTYLALK